MTREEAKMILEEVKIMDDSMYQYNTKYLEALNMAIKALEQLTSYEQTINKLTKAISEQEPFDIETYCKEHFCVMVDKDVWEKAEKALEQEPCKDLISRAEAIDACDQSINLLEAVDRIKELPRK
ncbi:MAG: hypothetical protein J6Y78_00280 [Paludibacteraceae bacterium]|nr:hypothetical protein [Paludibacteraceae bacterium]